MGWVLAGAVSAAVGVLAAIAMTRLGRLALRACRAGGDTSLKSLVALALARLVLVMRVMRDWLVRRWEMTRRRIRRQTASVYYRRLRRIQDIYQRMDQTEAVRAARVRLAVAIQVVLVRDQGGQVDELDEQVRALARDALPEVLARKLVHQELQQ